ncbi:MAG TPA: hypothetical protein VEX15_24205 [Nocardioidaceae bacterium]|nr:hypothetical protein [Nocardioidaceae bacterium]
MNINQASVAALGGGLVLALTVGAGGASAPAVVRDSAGQASQIEYEITVLEPADGGTGSGASSISDNGWVTGVTDVTSDGVVHATLWRDGEATDLDTLGGPNSAVLWPNKNTGGLVVGVSEIDKIDPRGEQWSCSAFFPSATGHVCRGFVWENDEMRALPTFGGTHGFAAGVNDRGLVVGWAETRQEDPSCSGRGQELQFVAATWDTQNGDQIRMLKPLPGKDSASAATAINDAGQIVGISGSCDQAVGRFTARAAVLWSPGRSRAIDLGDLGAEAWNTPMAINNHGVVVGFANTAGVNDGAFDALPFRWTARSGMDDLDTLGDDPNGQALGINDDGVVVGFSRAVTGQREHRDHAVVWRDGEIVDLNELTDFDGHLASANDIDNAGVITGQAVTSDGRFVAYVATPLAG